MGWPPTLNIASGNWPMVNSLFKAVRLLTPYSGRLFDFWMPKGKGGVDFAADD